MASLRRVAALFRAFAAGHGASDTVLSALMLPAALTAAFAGLARGELTGFAHALVFLTLTGLFVAVPLLGDLAHLLRADASEEWIGALPATPREVRVARAAHLVVALLALAAGPLVPAALIAPEGFGLGERLALLACGAGVALFFAALLLLVQALLAGRAEGAFVLFQTLLVAGVFLGLVLGLRHLPVVGKLTGLEGSALRLLPTAWFALPFAEGSGSGVAVPLAISVVALAVVLFLPRVGALRRTRRATLLERVLAPARALATRLWVRPDERGPFDLVYDALPREREVVLRTYPMIGIPLAFLVAAATGEASGERQGLLALLLFTPGIYLPVLLAHVPASESSEARWLLGTAPVAEGAVANGAIKALAVRFLLPLYALLFALAWNGAGLAFALRLAVPGGLVTLLVLRWLYGLVVPDPPLSVAPDRIQTRLDWSGNLLVLAVGLTVLGVAAAFRLDLAWAAVASAGLVLAEVALGRALRRRLG